MKLSWLCLTLTMFVPAAVASAAATDPPAGPATPVLVAAADAFVSPVHVGRLTVEAKPTSAGVAEALPDLPMPTATPFAVRTVLLYPTAVTSEFERSPRLTVVADPLPQAPGVSLLQSSPLAWSARRIGAQHFNTQDGSSVDAFAICYRVSNRSSVQVIPGDPAPVKIPVTSMANNMGVTVGMVLRLSKIR